MLKCHLKYHIILLLSSFQLFGCSGKEIKNDTTNSRTIYVVSQGWHTGLTLSTDCIADSLWPEDYQYNQYENLLVGWGDTDYYQNKGFNLWYATKAAVWATPSTLHIKAFDELNDLEYLIEEKVKLQISEENYENLCLFLYNQFQLNDDNQLIPQKAGFYRNSRFFESSKKYTAINNSNVWTAKALKEAGFNITHYKYLTQKSIIKKAKKIANQQ